LLDSTSQLPASLLLSTPDPPLLHCTSCCSGPRLTTVVATCCCSPPLPSTGKLGQYDRLLFMHLLRAARGKLTSMAPQVRGVGRFCHCMYVFVY
jgi:hypothetical protein